MDKPLADWLQTPMEMAGFEQPSDRLTETIMRRYKETVQLQKKRQHDVWYARFFLLLTMILGIVCVYLISNGMVIDGHELAFGDLIPTIAQCTYVLLLLVLLHLLPPVKQPQEDLSGYMR